MTMAERVQVVATCKGVFQVIPSAPCPGIPEEFLRKHNIHIVCLSTEYDKPDDIYYAIPRKLGITRVLPRTEGISTSDLIKRVKAYGSESKQKF
jgi:glycerol-3-phosphate cytidylyltransferase-like family protein